jgi:hypothetical protein
MGMEALRFGGWDAPHRSGAASVGRRIGRVQMGDATIRGVP